jgi:thioesterase domain-containing protein
LLRTTRLASVQESVVHRGSSSTLVAINPHGSRIPFYLVHDICSDVHCYNALARALGPDQPLFAFAVKGTERDFPKGVEAIASAYLRDLHAFDPIGPYIFGGYSFGGVVGYEMARQLRNQGGQALDVVMFDSFLPGAIYCKAAIGEQASIVWNNVKAGGIGYLFSKMFLKATYWRDRTAKAVLSRTGTLFDILGLQTIPPGVRKVQTEVTSLRALYAFKPAPYEGQVVLIACDNPYRPISVREDPLRGWTNVNESLFEVWFIPSSHSSLMEEPIIGSVAQRIRERINDLVLSKRQPPLSATENQRTEILFSNFA